MASGRGRSPARSLSHRRSNSGSDRVRSNTRSPSPTPRASRPTLSPRLRDDRRSLSRSRSPLRRRRTYSRSPPRRSSPPRSAKIVVEKLTKNVNEGHLKEIFGAYGNVKAVDMPMNKQCGSFLRGKQRYTLTQAFSLHKPRDCIYHVLQYGRRRSCDLTHA